jgi:hypothetical protein
VLRADACELLVVFLSHDECMKQIYSVDDGKFIHVFTGVDSVTSYRGQLFLKWGFVPAGKK